MTRLVKLTAAIALLVLAAAPSAQAAKRPACARAGTTTVAENTLARVYTRPSSNQYYLSVLYGCLKKTNRSRRLSASYDDDYVSSADFSLVQLTGRFVAYYHESYDISCKAACPPDWEATKRHLTLVDLRHGTRRVLPIPERPAGGILLADARGSLVWPNWLPGNRVEIRVVDGGGERVVDSGAIHPESLKLTSSGWLSWVNDSVLRGVQLVKL